MSSHFKFKNGYEYMVELDNNLKISPYHPIYTHSMLKYKWLYPKAKLVLQYHGYLF